jgi:hypothetical protein
LGPGCSIGANVRGWVMVDVVIGSANTPPRLASPSQHPRFASFNTPQITEVGVELDHELAALLEHLDAPLPAALTDS